MKRTKINSAYLVAAFVTLSVFFISCNGNDTAKQENTETELATPPDTLSVQQHAVDTLKVDSSRTEQNPPAIRRPSTLN